MMARGLGIFRNSTLAFSTVFFLSACAMITGPTQGVVMAPSSVECIEVVDSSYTEVCVLTLV